jgi:hypothetical protein
VEVVLETVERCTEIDSNGHVNNAKYVGYLEWGRCGRWRVPSTCDATARRGAGRRSPWHVKIWYDPRTWRLFRRTVAIREGDVRGTLTETYDEYVLNGDIPDGQFKLPADTTRGGVGPPPESRKR